MLRWDSVQQTPEVLIRRIVLAVFAASHEVEQSQKAAVAVMLGMVYYRSHLVAVDSHVEVVAAVASVRAGVHAGDVDRT